MLQTIVRSSCGCITDRSKPEGQRRTRCVNHTPKTYIPKAT